MKILVLLSSTIDNDSRVKNLISVLSNNKKNLIFLQYVKKDSNIKDYNFHKSNVIVKSYSDFSVKDYNFLKSNVIVKSYSDFSVIEFIRYLLKFKKLNKLNKKSNPRDLYFHNSKINFLYLSFRNLYSSLYAVSYSLIRNLYSSLYAVSYSLIRRLLNILNNCFLLLNSNIRPYRFRSDALKFKPDIVHANDLSTLPLGALIKKKCNAKLIYDSHELETDRNLKLSYLEKLIRFNTEKKNIKLADKVITVSESIANYLSNLYSIKKPLVIYNTSNLKSSKKEQSAKKNILDDYIKDFNKANIILYIGLVSFNRGIENLIEVFTRYFQEPINKKTNYLFIIGPVSPLFRAFNLDIFDLNESNNIHILPPVSQNEIARICKNANVSVIPIQNCCKSYDFALPNKLFESVFSNLPVAASNLSELSKFIKKYKCGELFNPTDLEDIAKKITKILLSDKKKYINDRKIEEINKIYSSDVQNQNIINLYYKI